MPADSTEQKTGGWAGDRVRHSTETANHKHIARYGEDVVWPNVVWAIIGILCAEGLAVFLLVR